MGQRLGSLIGAVGGLLFVLLNAGPLASPVAVALRLAGAAVFVVAVWYAVIRTRSWPPDPQPDTAALRTYWICVIAEALAIPLGALVLIRVLKQPDLTPAWVVLVVGAHFLPFAKAFRVGLFALLAWALVVVAVIGGLVTALGAPIGATAAGVVAGFLLLAFAVAGATLRDRTVRPSQPAASTPRPKGDRDRRAAMPDR